MTLPLSVLDLVPIPSGSSGPQALRNCIDLARTADTLGYVRPESIVKQCGAFRYFY
jgi:hypothetical protein